MEPRCPPVITVTDSDTDRLAPPLDECAHLENFVFPRGEREKKDDGDGILVDTPVFTPQDPIEEPRECSLGDGGGVSPLSSGSTLLPEIKTACQGCHCAPDTKVETSENHKRDPHDPFDYGKRYASDAIGEELSNPSSRFWRTCLDETGMQDSNLLQENGQTIDGVLIFAGIFSAVLSTFIVQIWQSLQTDYGQVTAILTLEMLQVQRAMADGLPTADIPATPSSIVTETTDAPLSVRWIISMWFVSLTLSLTAALLALLGRQWLQSYAAQTSGSAQERGRVRHSRYMGLVRWRVPEILQCLPTILHASLALFFTGLIIALARLNLGVVYFVAALVGSIGLFYCVATILPIVFPQCPYRTPLTYVAHRAFHALCNTMRRDHERPCVRRLDGDIDALDRSYIDTHPDEMDGAAISWTYDATSNPSIKLIAFEAIAGLRVGFKGRIQLRTSIVGELLRAVRNACSQGDVLQLEVLVRAYVQMQEYAALGQVVSRDLNDWSDNHILSVLESHAVIICSPQLDAALCCVGYYPAIDVTQKLYDIVASPNRSTLRLHPIIWIKQFAKAQASSHKTLAFLLATEMLNILTSIDFFDTQQFIAPSDVPTTSLAEPTLEMALGMVNYIHCASSGEAPSQSGCTAALVAYLRQVGRLLNSKGRDIVDLDALEHARNAVKYSIARESRNSFALSRAHRAAYRDSLLSIASSSYFQKSDFSCVRLLLGSLLSELHEMLIDDGLAPFPVMKNRSFGVNLFRYILSYNVGCNQASERDVWDIASHLFDEGSPFIFEAFMQMDGIASLYHIFCSGTGAGPSASQLALAYLSGFLTSQKRLCTLESELLYIHSGENLCRLVVMILYEERHEELLELIAVAPERFTSNAWSACVIDLLNWTLGKELGRWPSEKRVFARETIEKLYDMFSGGFCLPDEGIVEECEFLTSGNSIGYGDAHSAPSNDDVFGPVTKIWGYDSYERRLCDVSTAFSSTARPASERVHVWFQAVAARSTDCLDSTVWKMKEERSASTSESETELNKMKLL